MNIDRWPNCRQLALGPSWGIQGNTLVNAGSQVSLPVAWSYSMYRWNVSIWPKGL